MLHATKYILTTGYSKMYVQQGQINDEETICRSSILDPLHRYQLEDLISVHTPAAYSSGLAVGTRDWLEGVGNSINPPGSAETFSLRPEEL